MTAFRSIIFRNLFFFVPFLLFLIVAGAMLAMYPKPEIHLAINGFYWRTVDALMPWLTMVADGVTITIFILLMLAWNRRYAVATGVAVIVASGITQLLKHTIYYGEPRPKLFFESIPIPLRLVPNFENDLYDTFPSGHTTAAFAFFVCATIAVQKNYLKALFFLVALLMGYTRIYLSQHFLSDVLGGAVIGTGVSLAVMTIVFHKKWVKLESANYELE